jgi:hypothetical protein
VKFVVVDYNGTACVLCLETLSVAACASFSDAEEIAELLNTNQIRDDAVSWHDLVAENLPGEARLLGQRVMRSQVTKGGAS